MEGTDRASGLTRREALRRGALVGTALWVAPLAQVVSVTPAAADTASAPRTGGGGGAPVGRPVDVPGKPIDLPAGHGPSLHAHPRRRRRAGRHHHHGYRQQH